MTWPADQLISWVVSWMWPFARIGAMLMAAPVFGASYVPARVRLALAALCAVVVAPIVDLPVDVTPFSLAGMLVIAQQLVIGLAMGIALRFAYVVFELAGQIIAQHMALHFASLVDPNSGVQVPMISQFYILLGTLVFFAIDGHLVAIHVLVESFRVMPIGLNGLGSEGAWHLVGQMSWVFAASLLFALPAVAALLVVNLSFGVMTRAAPQLNIFSVGFPVTLLLGFGIIFVTLPNVIDQIEPLFEVAIGFVRSLPGGG